MQNVVRAATEALGYKAGKLLFGADSETGQLVGSEAWSPLDDVVMGGASESTFVLDRQGGEGGQPAGLFAGTVTPANSAG